ncbi:MAG: hypothetical protein F4Y45_10005 [Acidobacteria bacterium]|nr:hypothetical protein [Acidobacteriota bacterium]MYD71630.1 hypothetical protein [Acidobacteriota bacterium]MYJ04414.1 hypothetical protein [Acidobacteriota bacterium]
MARRRGAARFAAGTLIPVAVWLIALPALGAAGFFTGSSFARPIGLLLIASAAGGAVAGSATGPGWRGPLAFALAFAALIWAPLLVVSSLPALAGRESLRELAIGLPLGFVLAYGLIGAFGSALSGHGGGEPHPGSGWARIAIASLVFAAAGLLSGLLVAVVSSLAPGASGLAGFAINLVGGAACVTASAAGGWWIAGGSDPSGR